MSSITRQRVGKYMYLYESESYWDSAKKRPDNKKTRIGKIDTLTGEVLYSKEYLDRLELKGQSVTGMQLWEKHQTQQSREAYANKDEEKTEETIIDSVKDFGVVYFLQELAENIGLFKILHDIFPDIWKEIFCLASYLISSDKPVMYCEDWVSSSAGLDAGSMSSQRISELLAEISYSQRNSFYQAWYKLIREKEYVALDITSVSSYSEQINSCERGYNRDGENLPQVNICMLFGEDSKLPVYQTLYSGSLRDVSTLKTTLDEFTGITGEAEIMLVMDKGFFSARNINTLLGNESKPGYRFLVSIPFTSKFAKSQVESERKDIDSIENVIFTSGSPIRGIHKLRAWGSSGVKLHTHIFFNPEKAVKDRNELFGYVSSLEQKAVENPNNGKLAAEYKKYLIIRKSQQADNHMTVNIREDVIAKELETAGWFVLLSNYIEDAQTAHDVYRMKDVVEKSFWKYKNSLGLDRLRVHSDTRMQNKLFIAFIALILASAIHNTMKSKDLFKTMTFDKLILVMAKLKSAVINGKTIIRPVTKEQLMIFEAYGIKLPDDNKENVPVPRKRGRKPKTGIGQANTNG